MGELIDNRTRTISMNTQVNDPKGAAGALKAPMHLIPPYALEQTAWVHKLGSEKYGPYNWRKTGVCATTYVSAIIRHLDAWRDGQDMDPESGISHIAHIATSCNILLDAGHCGTLQDDRNKKPVPNTFAAAVAKAESVKGASVAMDQRVLPIHPEWTLPPVPEGYDRWVYRGTFEDISIDAADRHVLYSFGGTNWQKTGYFSAGYHHIEAIKDESVALDQRVFPIPSGWNLPPVPKGYDRWVYRGTFSDNAIDAEDRHVLYNFEEKWHKTIYFSGGCHHIEAVEDESVSHEAACPPCIVHGCVNHRHQGRFIGDLCAPCHAYITSGRVGPTTSFLGKLDELPPYPSVPEGYTRWVYRGEGWKSDRKVIFAVSTSPYTLWTRYTFGCTVGYAQSHYIEAVK